MPLAVIILVGIFSIYVAIAKPAWIWFAWLLGPTLFVVMYEIDHKVGLNGASAGSIALRPYDGALIGLLIGVAYHARRGGWRNIIQSPGGKAVLVFLAFVVLKTLASVLILEDAILQVRTASHAAGGLVAAVGEVRDNLVLLFPALYVYTVPESRDLKMVAWPLFSLDLLLVLAWISGVASTGNIWTGTNNPFERPIDATTAISLTQLGFLFLFMRVPRVSSSMTRCVACFGICVATLANHRSQWMAMAAGGAVLSAIVLFGRPIVRDIKKIRVIAAGVLLFFSLGAAGFVYVGNLGVRYPIVDVLTVRMYAFTNPEQDADAKWRQSIWKDRIEQVGSNWPWGRALGARSETLLHGKWVTAPDHSAYVQVYELGGVILSLIIIFFFGQLVFTASRDLISERDPELLWPTAVGFAMMVSDLAFGGAYAFPFMCPALTVILLVGNRSAEHSASYALERLHPHGFSNPNVESAQRPVLGQA